MNFTGTERLVRRISEALKAPDLVENASPLAQEYADCCRLVELRLEQCGALLNEGNELQAIQLAEDQPALLDLIQLLGFGEAPDWASFCKQHELSIAAPFDSRLISRLNQVYSKGITPDHPLLREYREAVLRRQDLPAMKALRSILRLNPNDQNARGEIERLERKLLNQKLDSLQSTLHGSKEGVANQVDDIEALNFSVKPSGPIFEEALRIREAYLRECALADSKGIILQLDPLLSADKWQAAEPMVKHIAVLKTEHKFQFDPNDETKWQRIQSWLKARHDEFEKGVSFRSACEELFHAVEQSEDKQAAQRQMGIAQVRTELETLVRKQRKVTDFGLQIPVELDTRYRKRTSILKDQIAKAQKNRTLQIAAASALAILACIVTGYIVFKQQQSSSLVSQMAKMRSAREVKAAEDFLRGLPSGPTGSVEDSAVIAAKAETRSFFQTEEDRQAKFSSEMDALELSAKGQFSDSDPDSVQKRIGEAQILQKGLAPDFQPAAEARLLSLQNSWEDFLNNAHDLSSKRFSAKLDELESNARNQLDFNRKPENLKSSVDSLLSELGKMEPLATTNISQLKLGNDLLARFTDLKAKVAPFRDELDAYSQLMANLSTAVSFDDYLKALQSLSSSKLVGSPSVAASKRVIDLSPSLDKLSQGLLMPGDPDGWAFLMSNPHAAFYPTSDVLDPEKRIYDQLVSDANLHSIFRYGLDPVNTPDASNQDILVQGQINGQTDGHNLTTKSVTDYNPHLHPDHLIFSQETLSGYFLAKGETGDSQAFRDTKFANLVDDSGTKFVSGGTDAPVQELLDNLLRDPDASPLFKGYMFLNIGHLVRAGNRENFWGLQYTPALTGALLEMAKLDAPSSGDWMVPEIVKAKEGAWDVFFKKLGRLSFTKQARSIRSLCLQANQIGFKYVGFVDSNGTPKLAQSDKGTSDLWGWDAASNAPTLIFRYSPHDKKPDAKAQAIPMSPLFVFQGDPQTLLTLVRHDQQLSDSDYDADVKSYLPLLFTLSPGKSMAQATP